MSSKKYLWIVLLSLFAAIKVFSLYPDLVERYYSGMMYPVISATQRILVGWIPFSIGDIFYALTALFLIVKVYRFFRIIVKKQADRYFWFNGLRQAAFFSLSVYVLFNLLWGMNYNRKGIADQLQLQEEIYVKEDLLAVVDQLVEKLNEYDTIGSINRRFIGVKRNLFTGAAEGYDTLAQYRKQFVYRFPAVKPSLYSYLGNYLGFTGYYNPFSGEAQVNTTVPLFVQPFTTCHEIGHQLGYAKESEANFAGFLSAKSSLDPIFKYSVYFEMYLYSRRYIYNLDSNLLKAYDARLGKVVKSDYRQLRAFWKKHENPVEKLVDVVYGQYLRANQQPSGKLSYSEVISWLIAYYKKYGKEAI
ncbi:DUF3810 domain-containing protein [Flavitalea antarctica]